MRLQFVDLICISVVWHSSAATSPTDININLSYTWVHAQSAHWAVKVFTAWLFIWKKLASDTIFPLKSHYNVASGTFKKKRNWKKSWFAGLVPKSPNNDALGHFGMAANSPKTELFDQLRISFLQIATLRAVKGHANRVWSSTSLSLNLVILDNWHQWHWLCSGRMCDWSVSGLNPLQCMVMYLY